MAALSYFAMLAFLITHELDAVKRHEWRVLPPMSYLPEKVGEQLFIWAHVPLFAGLSYFGALEPASPVAKGLSFFAIFHTGLHWKFRNHPNNEFNNFSSWALIVLAGLCGLAHLIIGW